MADVFKDLLVVIESADGARRGALTPDEFRAGTRCSKTHALADCIKDWNARQSRLGQHENRARLEMGTQQSRRRQR